MKPQNTEYWRTFIAIEITKPLKEMIRETQATLRRTQADVKWVSPDNIHLTLRFLGDTPCQDIEKVKAIVRQAAEFQGPFSLEINRLGAFPHLKHPRVLWVGLSKGEKELSNLARQLDDQLQKAGFEKEAKGFSPHITIGRVRSSSGISDLCQACQNIALTPLEQQVHSVMFIKSTLTPQGPIYETLFTAELKKPAC